MALVNAQSKELEDKHGGAVPEPRKPRRARARFWKAPVALVTALAVAVFGANLVASGPVVASAQPGTSSSTPIIEGSGGVYLCPAGDGHLLEQPVPCDYGTSPPALLNEGTLSSGLYAATPAQQASLDDFEQQAIANTISDHDLSASDTAAVETYGRYDAEGELWALITQAIETPAASQTTDQQNVVAWLSAVAQRQDVQAADDAGLEYAKWAGLGATNYEDLLATNPSESQLQGFLSGTPAPYGAGDSFNTPSSTSNEGYCDYVSPSGAPNAYTNNVYASMSAGGAEPQCFPDPCYFGCGNIPYPSYNDFVQWGTVDAQDSYEGSGFSEVAHDIAAYAGFGAAATAGLISAPLLIASALTAALTPFAAVETLGSTVGAVTAEAAADAAAAALGGVVAIAGVASLALLVVAGIVASVLFWIQIENDQALPGQLASLVYNAPNGAAPDLTSMLASSSQTQDLYSIFVGATLPDPLAQDCNNVSLVMVSSTANPAPCWNAPPVAAESPSDPGFVVTEKGSTTSTASRTISWQDNAFGTQNSAYLSGHWFVDTSSPEAGGSSTTLQELQIQYTDWSGDEELAWLVGNDTDGYHFVTFDLTKSASGQPVDPSTCAAQGICGYSPTIDYVGTDGKDYSASVVPASTANTEPPPTAGISGPTGTVPTASPVTFTADASSPAGLALSYSWCYLEPGVADSSPLPLYNPFGPSTTTTAAPPPCAFSGTGQDFSVSPDQVGTATVTLTVTDSAGNSTTVSSQLTVYDTTSTTVAVSPSSPVVGQAVTYTATVSPGPGESALNFFSSGYVSFVSGSGQVLCANVALDLAGHFTGDPLPATCTTTYTSAGPEQVTAYYGGSSGYATSSGSASTTVGLAPTETKLSVTTPPGTGNEPVVSEPFSYTATVSLPAGNTTVPTGTVSFSAQGAGGATTTLCAAVALSPSTDGTWAATCPAQASSAGDQAQVTATYSGDAATKSSSASTSALVQREQVALALSAPTSALVGQAVTYSAVLRPLAPATALDLAGGTVSFHDNQGHSCQGVVPSGVPATATCTLTYTQAATVPVTAYYSGDANTLSALASTSLEVGAVAPGAPAGLTATASDGAVHLAWQAPAADGGAPIEGYRVYQASTPGGEGATPLDASLVRATSYSVAGLAPGGTYYFTVAAVTSAGTSQPSNEAAVTLPAVVPGAPGALSATAGVGTVALSWAAPTSNGGAPIEGYDVYQATSPSGPTTLVNASAPLSATAYTVGGLSAGQAYYFSVEAVNAVGNGPASALASATPETPATTTTTTTGTTSTTTGTTRTGSTTTTTSGQAGTTTTGTTTTSGQPGQTTTTGSTTTTTSGHPGRTTTTSSQPGTTTTPTPGQPGTTPLLVATTTKLSSGPAKARVGQAVTVTATVVGARGGPPGGTVSFRLDGTPFGSPARLAKGSARAHLGPLPPGSYKLSATYSGGNSFAGSGASLTVTVGCPRASRSSTCAVGTTVRGPLRVGPGGTLALAHARVAGPVMARGAALVMVCGSTLIGPLDIVGAKGPVTLGGPAGSACPPDHVEGRLRVLGAAGPVSISRTSTTGPLVLLGNRGGALVQDASAGGELEVVGNSGPVTLSTDTAHRALDVSWNTGALELSANTADGPATVSFNSGPRPAVLTANTARAGLYCQSNVPALADMGVPNHVRGAMSPQCPPPS